MAVAEVGQEPLQGKKVQEDHGQGQHKAVQDKDRVGVMLTGAQVALPEFSPL